MRIGVRGSVVALALLALVSAVPAAAQRPAVDTVPAIAAASTPHAEAVAVRASSAIGRYALAHADELGAPSSPESCVDDACVQQFAAAAVTWHPDLGVVVVPRGDIAQRYRASAGTLGPALHTAPGNLVSGGAWQRFAGGVIVAGPGQTGVHVVRDRSWRVWNALGRERGALGYPVTEQYVDASGTIVQDFERGRTYGVAGGVSTRGDIGRAYDALGGTSSRLGPPTGSEYGVQGGFAQDFERGLLSWSAHTGAHAVVGGMLASWRDRGAEQSWLGLPLEAELQVPGGVYQLFQAGELYWNSENQQVVGVGGGAIRDLYHQYGGPFGPLGIATGERTATGEGFYQRFASAAILWGPHTGAHVVGHRALDTWLLQPSAYGWPTQDSADDPDRGRVDTFEAGQIITDGDRVWSGEAVDAGTAIVLCDSQCSGDSWVEQGLRSVGFPNIIEHAFPGAGYEFPAPALGESVLDAITQDRLLLPHGTPGIIVINLGGNDSSQGISDAVIRDRERALIETMRGRYPDTPIVVDGVMSRSDPDHERRRAVDTLIVNTAREMGVLAISAAGWGSRYGAAYLDPVHLAPRGHDTIAPHYADALRAVLG